MCSGLWSYYLWCLFKSKKKGKRCEFAVSTTLPHDYIVEVLSFEQTEDGSFALVMEYLEGEELRTLLKREKTLAPERVVRMLSQVAIGLDAAHARKIVHRDLKPDNIFLCSAGEGDRVKILDLAASVTTPRAPRSSR